MFRLHWNTQSRFRLALTLASLACASVVLMLCGMLSYYMHLYPTLQKVEIMNGHLEPPFQPHIFESAARSRAEAISE